MLMNGEKEREKRIRDSYSNLVDKILPIGDISVRQQTKKDSVLVGQSRTLAQENPSAAIDNILTIFTDDNRHSVLAEVQAMIALYDITTESNLWTPNNASKIIGVLNKIDDEDQKIILTGALFARFRSDQVQHGQQQSVADIFNAYFQEMRINGSEDYALGVFGSANGITKRLKDQTLRMTFPVSIENTGGGKNYESGSSGSSGIPDSVMHLGQSENGNFRLPSWEKIIEGSTQGMPDGLHVTELRIPHVMIGVQVNSNAISQNTGSENISNRRELYHVSLTGLDALSVILAIRTLRTNGLEAESLEPSVDNIINEKLLNDTDFTVLKIAWGETNNKPFNLEKAVSQLKAQALYFCLKGEGELRNEQEIMHVILRRILGTLTPDDIVDFALIEMRNMDSKVRTKLEPYAELDQINAYLSQNSENKPPLNTELKKIIWHILKEDASIFNRIFVSRFETIKDKKV